MMKKRVLLISYLFPPIGGAGVQRNLKYVKYLPDFDWQPYVLTVKDINYYLYDKSLTHEVPLQAQVIRTESLDPLRVSNLLLRSSRTSHTVEGAVHNRRFTEASAAVMIYRRIRDLLAFPDAQIGWIPFAYYEGLRIIRKHNIKVIMGSIAPVSSAIIAYLLARRTGLPYLLDFRDGWLDDPYAVRPTKLHKWGHAILENKVVGGANFVTVYDKFLSRCLVERYTRLNDRISVLPNGFDPADLDGVVSEEKPKGTYRIVYTGNLYGHHDLNFKALLTALQKMRPEILDSSLEILFVGQAYEDAKVQVARAGLTQCVKFIGYVPHTKSLGYLLSADATLLFIRPGDISSLTGKVFEYLMVQKPIIACVEPEGACGKLLRDTGQKAMIVPPCDTERLAKALESLLLSDSIPFQHGATECYNRKFNTQQLAQILNNLA